MYTWWDAQAEAGRLGGAVRGDRSSDKDSGHTRGEPEGLVGGLGGRCWRSL